jgi:hypothetical protein
MAAAVALPLGLTACATTSNDSSLTPAQNQLRQANRNWYTTVATGVAGGAALGALAGSAMGGRGQRTEAALIGGLIGAVGAGMAATQVASRNYDFANRELNAQQRLQAANSQVSRLETLANAAESTAAQNRRTLEELDRQYRARQITAADYVQRTQVLRQDLAEMQTAVSNARDMRQQLLTSRGSMPELRAAEERMGPAQRRLEASASELDELLKRVPSV